MSNVHVRSSWYWYVLCSSYNNKYTIDFFPPAYRSCMHNTIDFIKRICITDKKSNTMWKENSRNVEKLVRSSFEAVFILVSRVRLQSRLDGARSINRNKRLLVRSKLIIIILLLDLFVHVRRTLCCAQREIKFN